MNVKNIYQKHPRAIKAGVTVLTTISVLYGASKFYDFSPITTHLNDGIEAIIDNFPKRGEEKYSIGDKPEKPRSEMSETEKWNDSDNGDDFTNTICGLISIPFFISTAYSLRKAEKDSKK
jgi:hypothetical protein